VEDSAIIERHRDRPRGNGGVGSGAENLVPSRRYEIRSVPLGFFVLRARVTKLESRCTGALSAETRSFALSVSGEGEREGKRVDEAKEKTFNCGALLRLQGLQSINPGRYSIQHSLRGGCQVHLEIFTISRSVPEMARGFFGHLINQF